MRGIRNIKSNHKPNQQISFIIITIQVLKGQERKIIHEEEVSWVESWLNSFLVSCLSQQEKHLTSFRVVFQTVWQQQVRSNGKNLSFLWTMDNPISMNDDNRISALEILHVNDSRRERRRQDKVSLLFRLQFSSWQKPDVFYRLRDRIGEPGC